MMIITSTVSALFLEPFFLCAMMIPLHVPNTIYYVNLFTVCLLYTSYIYGTVENSLLFSGAVVEAGACVKDSIIMADTVIGSGSSVIKSILDEDVRVGKNCMIGGEEAIAVIGSGVNVGDDKTIAAGEMIEPLATI